MKVAILAVVLSVLYGCSKSSDNDINNLSGIVGAQAVRQAITGVWQYDNDSTHFVSYGMDGVRCIGYSPDVLNQCMRYDIVEKNGVYKLCICSINDTKGEGSYEMVATLLTLTDSTLTYKLSVMRTLHRLRR